METIFVTIDQETKLVLLPETNTERVLLEELLNKGSVTADVIKGPVDIMGRPAIGGVLIQASYRNDTSKDEDVRPVHPDETYLEK